jgi:hypothetical protein
MDIQTLIDKAGGVAQLARLLGCGRTTVLDWRRSGTIPGHRVRQVSEVLDLPITEVVKLVASAKGAPGPNILAFA